MYKIIDGKYKHYSNISQRDFVNMIIFEIIEKTIVKEKILSKYSLKS